MAEKNLLEIQKKIQLISSQIIQKTMTELFMEYRFMNTAIIRLKPINDDMIFTMATDGNILYYAGRYIIKMYQNDVFEVSRSYLHSVLHCIFLHPFVSEKIDKTRWNFACDIAVENVLTNLGGKVAKCKNAQYQQGFIARISKDIDSLTAEKIYKYLCDNNFTDTEIELERKNFKRDSHQLWFKEKKEKNQEDKPAQANEPSDSEGAENLAEIMAEWEDYCKKMNVDMENFNADTQGKNVLIQNTRVIKRDKYDYGVFLEKFAVTGEDITINDEEFDYIYYTYGLEKYKNMPLVEPLEYKEIKKISEFAIAIDTSGSVQGDLVQRFLDKTYSILTAQENFFKKINIRIFQCDDKIEDEFVVNSPEDFDYYIKNIKFKGFGGTDFTPVFDRINHLIDVKEFTNLKGVIYFTDGYGKYPTKCPDYDSAFIFLDYDTERPKVPSWAMGIIIDENTI